MVGFRVFGPIRWSAAQGEVPLGPPKQLCVAAALLLNPGTLVPLDALIDRIWGAAAPDDPAGAVATYVSRLRALFTRAGADADIVFTGGGYRLDCEPDVVDLHRARRLARLARQSNDDTEALKLLSQALAEMAGEPLGAAVGGWAGLAREQLIRERLDVQLERLEIEQRLGQVQAVVAQLRLIAAEHPLAEHVTAALMRALCAAGRPAEALDHFAAMRQRLAAELGCEPAPQLQELFRGILRQEPGLFGPAQEADAGPVVCTLPRDTPHFVGRGKDLEAIDSVAGQAGAGRPVVIAIDGMPGVGKTALAIRAAHSIAPGYPDGQLFVDMRAGEPASLLLELLRLLGVPGERVPLDLAGRSALWRATVSGRRLLIVLDDASEAEQVRAMLPGTGRSAVVVTSRRRLVDLGPALGISLDGLPANDCAELFRRVSERSVPDGGELADLTALCGNLPLAIRIAASRLRHRPSWTVTNMVGRLSAQAERLTELSSGSYSVSAAFLVAYDQLDEAHQRMFRLLGVHPGAVLERFAAAALAGPAAGSVREVDDRLQHLVDEHLVEEPRHGAYRQHDLARLFAQEVAAGPELRSERAEAERSIVEYYLMVAFVANKIINPLAGDVVPDKALPTDRMPHLNNVDGAFEWLEANRSSLRAAVELAYEREWHRPCWQLAASLGHFYNLRGYGDDWLATHEMARQAADRCADWRAEAMIESGLAGAHWRMGDYDAALRSIERALALRDHPGEPGDDAGLARARNNHGMMLHYVGRYGEALDSYDAARDLFHRLGDALGEAGVLNNTSISWQHMGKPAEAIAVLQEGLTLLDRAASGGKAGGGAILQYRGMLTGNLGGMLRKTGRTDEAVAHLEEAVRLRRESGATSATASALNDLASAYRSVGRLGKALDLHQEAIGLMRAIADRPAECIALNDLGFTQSAAGEPEAALESFQQAMLLAGTAGQPYERGRALVGISRILSRHDARAGQEAHQEATATFAAIGAHFDDELDGV